MNQRQKATYDALAALGADFGPDAPLFAQAGKVVGPTRPPFESREIEQPRRQGHRPVAESSKIAEAALDRKSDYFSILQWLAARPWSGGTHKEWCETYSRESNTSGRFTELGDVGWIDQTENRRRGGLIWMITAKGVDDLAIIKAKHDGRPEQSSEAVL